MDDDRADAEERQTRRREPIFNPRAFEAWPVIALVASFVAIQLYADWGGTRVEMGLLRDFAFFSARFWNGQGYGALLSYAFLHAGWLHLAMNGAACFALGTACWRYMGTVRFGIFFALTAIAGAVAFALVRPEAGPLVGASGAIFGLLAAVKRVEFRILANRGHDMRRTTLVFLAQIVLLNVVIGAATMGLMAWEAHLGGMALGWLITPYLMKD